MKHAAENASTKTEARKLAPQNAEKNNWNCLELDPIQGKQHYCKNIYPRFRPQILLGQWRSKPSKKLKNSTLSAIDNTGISRL